jgi:hypothetical protein
MSTSRWSGLSSEDNTPRWCTTTLHARIYAHSDFYASDSGVLSSRELQSGNRVSLATTGVQWLVIAVGISRIAECLPWLPSAKWDAGTSSLKTTWVSCSRSEMTRCPAQQSKLRRSRKLPRCLTSISGSNDSMDFAPKGKAEPGVQRV